MYQRIIKPILFMLNIEQAHRVVGLLLRFVGLIPGGRWWLDKCYAVHHPALEKEVFGVHFTNPVGLAAGFDRNGEAFRELSSMGFGFIELGTITPSPQGGNPRPRVFRLTRDNAIINRMGVPNRGLKRTIQSLRHPHGKVVVGCNIGRNLSTPPQEAAGDYLKVFRNLYQYTDYFTVNVCCDSSATDVASHSREFILSILEPLFDFRRGQNQYRPIMLKISPDLTDEQIDEITEVLIDTPLDGIVATNGTHMREELKTSEDMIDKIGNGRLSGKPLTKRSIEIVRRIHTRTGGTYPIIGVGGLMTPDDVREMLKAGADLVQIYTGYIYQGPSFVKQICTALVEDAEREAVFKAEAQRLAEEQAAAEAEAKRLAEEAELKAKLEGDQPAVAQLQQTDDADSSKAEAEGDSEAKTSCTASSCEPQNTTPTSEKAE